MEQTIRQKPKQQKIKGVADIVFCVDASGSMSPCIDGLKDHIASFLEGISSNKNLESVDWRLGFLAHDSETFYVKEFVNDINDFKTALKGVTTGGDEFTLPALDWCVDFPWRENSQRVVVLFTDETLETGADPGRQRSRLRELTEKIMGLRVMVYFVGPDCPEYKSIADLPRCYFNPVDAHSGFFKTGFEKVLERIGKTLSGSLTPGQTPSASFRKDIYNVAQEVKITRL
ncbi:MAG: VWA domain-containing protein [Nitrospirae bacterium]|nr:VWA domain-containing protein [Nitrospirota bacterium]